MGGNRDRNNQCKRYEKYKRKLPIRHLKTKQINKQEKNQDKLGNKTKSTNNTQDTNKNRVCVCVCVWEREK